MSKNKVGIDRFSVDSDSYCFGKADIKIHMHCLNIQS
jgi:hypothetical protein